MKNAKQCVCLLSSQLFSHETLNKRGVSEHPEHAIPEEQESCRSIAHLCKMDFPELCRCPPARWKTSYEIGGCGTRHLTRLAAVAPDSCKRHLLSLSEKQERGH